MRRLEKLKAIRRNDDFSFPIPSFLIRLAMLSTRFRVLAGFCSPLSGLIPYWFKFPFLSGARTSSASSASSTIPTIFVDGASRCTSIGCDTVGFAAGSCWTGANAQLTIQSIKCLWCIGESKVWQLVLSTYLYSIFWPVWSFEMFWTVWLDWKKSRSQQR